MTSELVKLSRGEAARLRRLLRHALPLLTLRGGEAQAIVGSDNATAPDDLVVMTRADYEEVLEDLADAQELRSAVNGQKAEDFLPVEHAARIFGGEHPARVWRQHRGLTMQAVAASAGVSAAYLSEIETGKKPGSVAMLRKIAAALDVRIEDLFADGAD